MWVKRKDLWGQTTVRVAMVTMLMGRFRHRGLVGTGMAVGGASVEISGSDQRGEGSWARALNGGGPFLNVGVACRKMGLCVGEVWS